MIDSLKLRTEKIPLSEIAYFSSTFLDYLEQNPKLNEFIGTYPTPEAFGQLITDMAAEHPELADHIKALYQDFKNDQAREVEPRSITIEGQGPTSPYQTLKIP